MSDVLLTGVQTGTTTEFTYTINQTNGNLIDVFYIELNNANSYRIDVLVSGSPVTYNMLRKNQANSTTWIPILQTSQNSINNAIVKIAQLGFKLLTPNPLPAIYTITIIQQSYN